MCLVTGCPDKGVIVGTRSRRFGRGDFCIKHSTIQEDIKPDRNAHYNLFASENNNNYEDDIDSYKVEKIKVEDVKKGQIPKLKLKLDSPQVSKIDEDFEIPTAVNKSPKKAEKKRQNKQSSERRKEKSRDAARCRRSKESELYSALSDCLPLPQEVLANLDKASIMRLAIACLNTGNMVNAALKQHQSPSLFPTGPSASPLGEDKALLTQQQQGSSFQDLLLQAIDGFLLVLSSNGRVDFVSPSISTHLGLPQVDVIGVPLSDLVHQCDHEDLRQLLQIPSQSANSKKSFKEPTKKGGKRSGRRSSVGSKRSAKASSASGGGDGSSDSTGEDGEDDGGHCFEPRHGFLRLKCTLASRGRNVTIRNASYKVVEISGKMVYSRRAPSPTSSSSSSPAVGWLICIAAPVPHPANIEVPLDSQTYFSKHSLDMKFTYADENFPQFCGFTPDQLEGKSLFQLHHELDGPQLRSCFHTLRVKGQVSTGQYRFLASGGGYVWLVTQATVIHSSARDSAPNAVVCLHYVISGVQCSKEIVSCIQLTDQGTSSDRSPSSRCDSVCGGGGSDGSSNTSASSGGSGSGSVLSNTTSASNTTNTASSNGARGQRSGGAHRAANRPMLSGPSVNTEVNRTTATRGSRKTALDSSKACSPHSSNVVMGPNTNTLTLSNSSSPPNNEVSSIESSLLSDSGIPLEETNPFILSANPILPDEAYYIPPSLVLDSPYLVDESNQSRATVIAKTNTCDANCDGGYGGGSWCLGNKNTASSTPLLSQAATDIGFSTRRPDTLLANSALKEQEDTKHTESFTSSTAELFTPLSCPIDESADPLVIGDFLFSSTAEPNDVSITSELFADDNFFDLKSSASSNDCQSGDKGPSTADTMDVIAGTNLFKSEPLYETEDFDGRAPFLPFSVDENVIMWSPSLEFGNVEEDSSGQDYSSDNSSQKSSASPAVVNSPDSVTNVGSVEESSFYLPDGSLNISALRQNNPDRSDKDTSSQCHLLEELLLEGSDCKTNPSGALEAMVQHQSCIDPNSVWPGILNNKNQTCDQLSTPPHQDFSCKDEVLELDKLMPDFELGATSPTLASSTLENGIDTQHSSPVSPLSQYTLSPAPYALSPAPPHSVSPSPYTTNAQASSLSPAFATFDPFAARSPSVSSLSSRHSSPVCSPQPNRPPDIAVINCSAVKRSRSPITSPQMNRKRLCSPHIDERSPGNDSYHQSSPGHSKGGGGGGRKLQKPHAPYMQHLLIPQKNEPSAESLNCGNLKGGRQHQYSVGQRGTPSSMQQMVGDTLPAKTVTIIPRSQLLRSNGNLFRLVENPIAYRTKPTESRGVGVMQIAGKGGGRTVLVRDKRPAAGSYITRNVNPLKVVTEKNVVEYVLPKMEDDAIEWIQLVEADAPTQMETNSSTHQQLIECSKPDGDHLTNIPSTSQSSSLYNTETTKCLLLPQNEYSQGNLFRLAQSDYEVNAPAPGSLLSGQDLLDALE